jgi:hypothetical protein
MELQKKKENNAKGRKNIKCLDGAKIIFEVS